MFDYLYRRAGVKTHMISAENPTGEKGKACMESPDPNNPKLFWSKNSLGKGYKVNPFIRIDANTKVVIADYKGMGVINQIFLTSDREYFSELVLRIYWDDEENPSVECPLGAFFCMGHDSLPHNVYSLPITVAPHRGLNSYFQMPFRKGFRIEIENEGDSMTWILAYKIIFDETEVKEDDAYFHATYRRTLTNENNPTHIILDGVEGKGVYVGTYLAWTQLEPEWWGEGEVKFYIDGDKEYPSICDNGTEDYFGGAWNFGSYGVIKDSNEVEFNSPFLGLPKVGHNGEINNKFSMYRFHILDSIGFNKDIKVTVDTIGWPKDHAKYKHTSEDVQSVAYWYQVEPHKKFSKLLERDKRKN